MNMQVGRPVVYFDEKGEQHPAQVAKDWGGCVNLVVFDKDNGDSSVVTSVMPWSEEQKERVYQAF